MYLYVVDLDCHDRKVLYYEIPERDKESSWQQKWTELLNSVKRYGRVLSINSGSDDDDVLSSISFIKTQYLL